MQTSKCLYSTCYRSSYETNFRANSDTHGKELIKVQTTRTPFIFLNSMQYNANTTYIKISNRSQMFVAYIPLLRTSIKPIESKQSHSLFYNHLGYHR